MFAALNNGQKVSVSRNSISSSYFELFLFSSKIQGIGLDPAPLKKDCFIAISPQCMVDAMKYIKGFGFNAIRTYIPFSGTTDSFSKADNEAGVKLLLGIGRSAYENGIFDPGTPK